MTSFDFFEYRKNELFCEDVRVKEIVESWDSGVCLQQEFYPDAF